MNIKKLSVTILLSLAPIQISISALVSKTINGSANLVDKTFDKLQVNGSLTAKNVNANALDVDGCTHLYNCNFGSGNVDGSLSIKHVKVFQRLDVDGSLNAIDLEASQLQVDGSADVTGGKFKVGKIDGSLTATNLELDDLTVDGSSQLINSNVFRANFYGSLTVMGTHFADAVTVVGRVDADGTTFDNSLVIGNDSSNTNINIINGKVFQGKYIMQKPHEFRNSQTCAILVHDQANQWNDDDDSGGVCSRLFAWLWPRKTECKSFPAEIILRGATIVRGDIAFDSKQGKVIVYSPAQVLGQVVGGVVLRK